MNTLTIHIDGAARGNPGPAAFAFVITADSKPTVEHSACLGEATNNVAEYTALVRALERALELGGDQLLIRSDSELLVKQMNGEYKVKNAALRDLYEHAQKLAAQFKQVTLQHVRREQNKRADELCNDALDGKGRTKPRSAAPSALARPPLPATSGPDRVRQELLTLLRETASSWGAGKKVDPRPEEVCDEIWGLLLAEGLVRLS